MTTFNCIRTLRVLGAATFVLVTLATGASMASADAAAERRTTDARGKLPLYFEANRGQADPAVKFFYRGTRYGLFLTPTEAVLALRDEDRQTAVRMSLHGSNPKPLLAGLEERPGKTNYFIGHDPATWRTDVPTYARVLYRQVYPGIDMVYYGAEQQIEFDFIVAPGADPDLIRLSIEGAQNALLTGDGDLLLKTAAGDVRLKQPTIYQENEKGRKNIAGRYDLSRKGDDFEVTFQLSGYDRSKPLTIDPALVYSTLLGGTDTGILGGISEAAFGVAIDAAGNAYITGWTTSLDFPIKGGLPSQPSGSDDAFIAKLNPEGTDLVYSTFFGGDGSRTFPFGIAVDASGSAYIVGITNGGLPTTPGAFQTTDREPDSEGPFVAKLNPAGNQLVYATYLSGSEAAIEDAYDIAVDTEGNAYVTGVTEAENFPVVNPIQPSTARRFFPEAFVTKLNPTGTALIYSTPLGGQGRDEGLGITVDSAGRAYVTGVTYSSDFPTVNAFQGDYHGDDAFVARLNAAGSALEYSTYLGGPNEEIGKDIAVDSAGSAYVTGRAWAGGFPTTPGAFRSSTPGGHDAFVTKFSSDGQSLVYSTYLGGANGPDDGHGIAVDSAGNAYITGTTASSDFPVLNAFQPTPGSSGGRLDAFVTELNPAGSALVYSSFIGGNDWENISNGDTVRWRGDIAVDAAGRAYVTGATSSPDFPTTPQAFQRTFRGREDAFLIKVGSAVANAPLTLESISPKRGGNLGTSTIRFHGTGFTTETAFRLVRPGYPEIAPILMTVPGGNFGSAVFDLREQSPGLWDVVARNSPLEVATLPAAFTIEAGGGERISTLAVGPIYAMRGRPMPFTFTVSNSGSTDAYGIIVFLGGLPRDAILKFNFDLQRPPGVDPSISPYIDDPHDPNAQVLPMFIPVLRAGESVPFLMTINVPTVRCVKLSVSSTGPLMRLKSEGGGNLCDGLAADAFSCLASLPGPQGCALGILDGLRETTCNYLASQSVEQQVESAVWASFGAFLGCADLAGVNKVLKFIYEGMSIAEGCAKLFTGKELGACFLTSGDPNAKFGSVGAGAAQYVSGEQPLSYLIMFENKPEATAPAHEVVITDQLDPSKFDFSTFSFGPIAFGDTVVTTPPGTEFTKDVDLRPARNTIVRISGALDKPTGLLTWRFVSLDPATGLPTDDIFAGFLPPNQNPPEGDGSVFFTVMPKAGLATGTEIRNQARILFDFNDPIDTPEWLNTIDNARPESQVLPLAPNQCLSFDVSWSGADDGSGIRSYTILASENGGPFTPWLRNTTATSAEFTGNESSSYAFYSVADDHAGNLENVSSAADAVVTIQDLEPPTITAPAAVSSATGPDSTACGMTIADTDLGAATATDNCSDVDVTRTGVPPGNFFAIGETTITYTATDEMGNSASATQIVTVVDNTPPVMSCVSDVQPPTTTASLPPAQGAGWHVAAVTVDLSAVDDASGVREIRYSATGAAAQPETVVPSSTAQLTVDVEGVTSLSFFAIDQLGNVEPAQTITIRIDKTAPTLTCAATPGVLGPPNHQLVPVTTVVTVHDAVSGPAGFTLISAVSNEPDNGQGDGDTVMDIQQFEPGTPDQVGLLRAERAGGGTGRVYSLVYEGTDQAGNRAGCTATVGVPH